MKKQINYLGRKWELKRLDKMYNKYEGWNMVIYDLLEKKEKGALIDNINYKNGIFNKLSDDIHIAIEKVSLDPMGVFLFNKLIIAFKDIDNWNGKLPEWNDNYLN